MKMLEPASILTLEISRRFLLRFQNGNPGLGVFRAGFRILSCLILLAASTAVAKDGRDFAGFYEVSNVVELGQELQVTLTVRVFNYSDADVNDATITLEDSLLPGETYGSYLTPVYVQPRESVRLSDHFTIPRREYEYWQEGGTPSLTIKFRDPDGNTILRMIELAPMLVGGEE